MILTTALLLALAGSSLAANKTVLGAYIFSRHGDRTVKSFPPVSLTPLGYAQVLASGSYYRTRYISDSSSPYHIPNVARDDVVSSQIYATAADDTTIYNSAQGFLQGLYPPAGDKTDSMTLRNGTTVKGAQDGYQLIQIHSAGVGASAGAEDLAWLQGATGCNNAQISSTAYYDSEEFKATSAATKSFYEDKVYPFLEHVLPKEKVNFKNAYTIFDLLNVASIHNSTESTKLPSDDVMDQVRALADEQQWNLAYNGSDTSRAIAGRTLAAQVVDSLQGTLDTKGRSKIGLQFGAYGTFQSFFGLAELPKSRADFYGIPDYASTIVFELLSTSADNFNPDDATVRFLFRNGTSGTAEDSGDLKAFSIFGGDAEDGVAWKEFQRRMKKFSVHTQEQWCNACGNSTGVCAAYSKASSSTASAAGNNGGSKGLSKAAAGTIGAVVAIAVVLALEALIALIVGLRIVKKNTIHRAPSPESAVSGKGSM